MQLDNYLNSTNFYDYAGLTSDDVNDGFVQLVINSVNGLIKQKLRRVFSFQENFSTKNYRRPSGQVVSIGNFQPAGVVTSIDVQDNTGGFTTAPEVQIQGEATAIAVLGTGDSSGTIVRVDITNQGGGYTEAPEVIISEGVICTAHISTDPVVLRGRDNQNYPAPETLIVSRDFRFIPFKDIPEPGRTYPYVGVMFYSDELDIGEYLYVTGVTGFAPSVPAELMLDLKLYEIVKKVVLTAAIETNSAGQGPLSAANIGGVSTAFDNTSRLTVQQGIDMITGMLNNIQKSYEIDWSYVINLIG